MNVKVFFIATFFLVNLMVSSIVSAKCNPLVPSSCVSKSVKKSLIKIIKK